MCLCHGGARRRASTSIILIQHNAQCKLRGPTYPHSVHTVFALPTGILNASAQQLSGHCATIKTPKRLGRKEFGEVSRGALAVLNTSV